MKNIYTYGLKMTCRNLTLRDIRANKSAGIKMTQATARYGEEAAGIDVLGFTSEILANEEFSVHGHAAHCFRSSSRNSWPR